MAKMTKVPNSMSKLQDFWIRSKEQRKKIAEQGEIMLEEMIQAGTAAGTAMLYGGALGYIKQNAINNGESEYFDGKIFKDEDGKGGFDIGFVLGGAGVVYGAWAASKKKNFASAVLGVGSGFLVPAMHDLGYGIGMELAKKSP